MEQFTETLVNKHYTRDTSTKKINIKQYHGGGVPNCSAAIKIQPKSTEDINNASNGRKFHNI